MSTPHHPTKLTSIEEVAEFLAASQQPVFHLSRSAPHFFGVDRWVPAVHMVQLRDRWAGQHPHVFTPDSTPRRDLRGGVEVVNWLLRSEEVQQYIAAHTPHGVRPQIIATFFDEEAERLCEKLGYDLILPSIALRTHLDSKIVTTQLANSAGISSVPNVLTKIRGWADLIAQAEHAGLGTDLVLQTAYGDSGNTTYFVASESDFAPVASAVIGPEIKVMKRVNHLPLAIEAVLTRAGTIVGPCVNELTGFAELTPHTGGWSGNDSSSDTITPEVRRAASDIVRRLGDRLGVEGYRGIFEIDLLLDSDTGDLYLGELNPRISGIAPISNIVSARVIGLPLMALHLLEYAGVDFELDIDAINASLAAEPAEQWTQMIIRHVDTTAGRIISAPANGRYRLGRGPDRRAQNDLGSLEFVANERDWYGLESENDAFFLQVLAEGDIRAHGDELGVLVTRGQLQTPDRHLNDRALHLVREIQSAYSATPLSAPARAARLAGRALRAVWSRTFGRLRRG